MNRIVFNKIKKLSNYNNRTYGYCHETIQIKNNKMCNDAKHIFLDPEWQRIVSERNMHKEREKMNRTRERLNIKSTEEKAGMLH